MRARLTLILTIAAVCLAFVPMTPAHAGSAQEPASAWFSTSARSREQQVHAVAQLRHAERARLSAVAKALTTPPIVVAAPPVAPAPTTAPAPNLRAAGVVAGPAPIMSLIWPHAGPILSPFGPRGGRRHDGIDIGGSTGAPIVAAHDGVVTFAGWESGYGNTVVIDHGSGVQTLYAHQQRFVVTVGQHLAQGELLGFLGSTGRVTAPHLHFEVHLDGVPRNPLPWL